MQTVSDFVGSHSRSSEAEHAATCGAFSAITVFERHHTIIVVAGEFDLAATRHFASALSLALLNELPVVIDCGRISFVNSTGASALIAAVQNNPPAFFVNVNRRLARLLILLGQDALISA